MKHNQCVFCKQFVAGEGNSPLPVKFHGVCCDRCNKMIVIPERIRQIFATAK